MDNRHELTTIMHRRLLIFLFQKANYISMTEGENVTCSKTIALKSTESERKVVIFGLGRSNFLFKTAKIVL